MAETKVCRLCGKEKPLADYSGKGMDRKGKPRVETRCRPCVAAYNASYRVGNIDDIKEYDRRRYREDDEYRADSLARSAAWKIDNPEREKEHDRNYRLRHALQLWLSNAARRERDRDKRRAASRARKKANPEQSRCYVRNRRARKKAAGGTHSAADIADIRRLQRDRCANPKCRAKLIGGGWVDHIISIAKGGTNDRKNLQLLCQPCNQRKSDKDPIAFMQELGLLL